MKILDIFDNYDFFCSGLHEPYLIAEAGVNHEGSMDIAKRLVREAKEGGADAIKFQTYRADTITVKESPAYWDISKEPTKTQYELFKKYDKFWKKEYEELKNYCDKTDIEFMSTPFDLESAEFLNGLMDVFKVSSSDITNKPFIEYICGFGKPIILSTGASNISEIEEAIGWIEKYGNKVALLHCVLNYPTEDKNANLGMIIGMKKKFPDKIAGYSDHTMPNDMKVLEVASMLGAVILEKHFTYDKGLPGNDHYHAMDKEDIKIFKKSIERNFEIIGESNKSSLSCEEISRKNARRSLVSKRYIPKGKRIEVDDLTWKRPATGVSPKHIDEIIGSIADTDIKEDSTINREMIKK